MGLTLEIINEKINELNQTTLYLKKIIVELSKRNISDDVSKSLTLLLKFLVNSVQFCNKLDNKEKYRYTKEMLIFNERYTNFINELLKPKSERNSNSIKEKLHIAVEEKYKLIRLMKKLNKIKIKKQNKYVNDDDEDDFLDFAITYWDEI